MHQKVLNSCYTVIPSTGGKELFGNPLRAEFPPELLPDRLDDPALLTGEPGLSLCRQ